MTKKPIRDKTCHREFLYSPHTEEEYSACKGDYFWMKEDAIFKDSEENNMWLMQRSKYKYGAAIILKKTVRVSDLKDIV